MKVIQVLGSSLSLFNIEADPKFYEGDWHVRVAKEIMKRTNKFEIECWRPERELKDPFVREDDKGIKYRIFPSTYIGRWEYSKPLLRQLKEEINREKEILIHIHDLYNLSTYSISFLFGRKVPVVAQSHGGSPLRFSIGYILQIISFRNIDLLFVLSKEEEKYFSHAFGQEKVKIQPMGIDFDTFKPQKGDAKEELNLDKSRIYLLYVGRLSRAKGLEFLLGGLKALIKDHPDLNLILVGDGPYKRELERKVNIFGIQKYVIFTGWLGSDKLSLYYNAADIFVFPSLHEAYGLAPLEALACGTPVISTPVGIIPQIQEELNEGIFIIPEKIQWLLKNV
ncbi:MAG: glycosyltransferase family 4 protein [Candidatus Marinimicrobia bacterium]|nr:glycosyltransferase family 4 protein [Candidatus Neomarinimicrobiota bacterium]